MVHWPGQNSAADLFLHVTLNFILLKLSNIFEIPFSLSLSMRHVKKKETPSSQLCFAYESRSR